MTATDIQIVTDNGFGPDDWTGGFIAVEGAAAGAGNCKTDGLDITPDDDLSAYKGCIEQTQMIRISFGSFADGRGFTTAKALRLMGYTGRLRAGAGLISDQYAMARRAGFDEVEITAEKAARQPESEWVFRADWQAFDHQARVRG